MIVGDVVGFCLNLGFMVCGMDLVIVLVQVVVIMVIVVKECVDFFVSSFV